MNGVLPVDKPAGPTSHDIVAAARRALRLRRIGHTGTLDPFATGLLLLCLGPATRLAEYLTGLDKRYDAVARLGVRTDTLDATGTVIGGEERGGAAAGAGAALSPERIRAAFEAERGTRLQQPPAFSAKRVAGRRAYELARAGDPVLPDPVEVTIHAIDVTEVEGDLVRFTVTCSSGTYIRAIARDVGERLGVGAHLTELRRTAIGAFRVEDALPMDALEDAGAVAAAVVSPTRALGHLPSAEIDEAAARRIRNGQAVPAPPESDGAARTASLVAVSAGGELVAVAEQDGELLRPRKVFA